MSAKRIPNQIEIHELGRRRLYVKSSTGFVLHNDDFTPEELLAIAQDIARTDRDSTAVASKVLPAREPEAPAKRSL